MVDLWDAIMIDMMEYDGYIYIYIYIYMDLWWVDQCNMDLDGI